MVVSHISFTIEPNTTVPMGVVTTSILSKAAILNSIMLRNRVPCSTFETSATGRTLGRQDAAAPRVRSRDVATVVEPTASHSDEHAELLAEWIGLRLGGRLGYRAEFADRGCGSGGDGAAVLRLWGGLFESRYSRV